MKNPKYKQGDIVKHKLTGEEIMVCELKEELRPSKVEEIEYVVQLQDLTYRTLPEWQLLEIEEESWSVGELVYFASAGAESEALEAEVRRACKTEDEVQEELKRRKLKIHNQEEKIKLFR